MARSTSSRPKRMRWAHCFGRAKDGVKSDDGACGVPDDRTQTAKLFVTAAGSPVQSESSSPASSPQLTRTPSAESAAEPSTWHDCVEEWEASDLHDVLPADLAAIIRKYQRGQPMGCKPTLALLQYMECTSTSLAQLKELLQPLLEAEDSSCDLPTPNQPCDPLTRTQSLLQQASAGSSSSSPPQPVGSQDTLPSSSRQPSIARLLGNVSLLQQTMQVMDSQDGFKQVAWGPLQLWYKHDLAAKRQIIKAKTILQEPVVNVVCLAREVDLVTQWNPAIADMCELGSWSPAELLVYLLMWVPWPLLAPEVVNYAVGIDMLDLQEACVLIATNGHLSELPAGVQLPQHPRAMRLTMDAGGFRFRPLPPLPDSPDVPRTETTVLVAIDAAKWAVPDAIISFVLKVFAPLVYKSVLKVLKRMFHSPVSSPSGSPATASRQLSASCSFSGEGDTALRARLAARPEYAAIAAHVQQHLAAQVS